MPKVMMTIRSKDNPPALDEIKRRYQLSDDEIDREFGVIQVDERDGTYTILVEESAASKISPGGGWDVEGPFSNPAIEPMWPPKT